MLGILGNFTTRTLAVSACSVIGAVAGIGIATSEQPSAASHNLANAAESETTLAGTTSPTSSISPDLPAATNTTVSQSSSSSSTAVGETSTTNPTTVEPNISDNDTATETEVPISKAVVETTQLDTTTTQKIVASPTPTTSKTTSSTGSVELQILNLVNEYRSNPNGRLKRPKPLPAQCPSADGLSPLALDQSVSTALSRDWSSQMAANNSMSHRPTGEQRQILESLNVGFMTWGENVAWQSGYRGLSEAEATVAMVFFEGWRDSDSHFCNIVNPSFTHTGIGHHFDQTTGKDWATQNFYG